MKINEEFPKTWDKYKNYLKASFRETKDDILSSIPNSLLITSIQNSPMGMTKFFDKIGMVGTVHFDYLSDKFSGYVNGEVVNIDEDTWLEGKERKEVEQKLINYIFSEVEKTL